MIPFQSFINKYGISKIVSKSKSTKSLVLNNNNNSNNNAIRNYNNTKQISTSSYPSTSSLQNRLLYVGGFEIPLRYLKRVSIFSCISTVLGVPLLAITSENPRMTAIQKGAVAFTVVLFGITTTVALHIVVKPYVTRMMLKNSSTNVAEITTLNLLGKPITKEINLDQIRVSSKPWATFETITEPIQTFFVEMDSESWKDDEYKNKLLKILRK
jgi:hypothetical protein